MAATSAHLIPPTPASFPTWEVRSANADDMRYLAPRLNEGSLEEIKATSKFQPISVLLQGMDRKAVIVDKAKPSRPVALLELVPIPGQVNGAFWSALTTDLVVSENYFPFCQYAESFLNHANGTYPTLGTYVEARNTRQIAWLERVGFTLLEVIPQWGRKELKFYLYTRTKEKN